MITYYQKALNCRLWTEFTMYLVNLHFVATKYANERIQFTKNVIKKATEFISE